MHLFLAGIVSDPKNVRPGSATMKWCAAWQVYPRGKPNTFMLLFFKKKLWNDFLEYIPVYKWSQIHLRLLSLQKDFLNILLMPREDFALMFDNHLKILKGDFILSAASMLHELTVHAAYHLWVMQTDCRTGIVDTNGFIQY